MGVNRNIRIISIGIFEVCMYQFISSSPFTLLVFCTMINTNITVIVKELFEVQPPPPTSFFLFVSKIGLGLGRNLDHT